MHQKQNGPYSPPVSRNLFPYFSILLFTYLIFSHLHFYWRKDGLKSRGFPCFFFSLLAEGLNNTNMHELLNNLLLITCFNDFYFQDLHQWETINYVIYRLLYSYNQIFGDWWYWVLWVIFLG